MRIRRASPLLLLLAPSLVAAQLPKEGTEVLSNDEILSLNRIKGAEPIRKTGANDAAVADPPNAKNTRIYKGTEDAPVDGLDGKPHAGPFVDRPAEGKGDPVAPVKAKPTSLSNFAGQDIPEKNDGVMNDDTRTPPKKGTTGTEGGISEKEKSKKEGDVAEKTPQTPQKAPTLPHSEEKNIKGSEKEKSSEKSTSEESKDAITGEKVTTPKKGGDYGEAGYGLEKPTNLPPKPHNIPHPDAKIPTTGTSDDEFGPPVNPSGGRDKWLVDTMPDTEGKTNLKPAKPKSGSSSSSGGISTPASPPAISKSTSDMEWHEWFHSFVLSFTMIIFSEIGDKTFLVAALMAMRHPRLLVFSAAISALMAMTVLSAVLGHAFPALLPKTFTTFAAAILFFVFGAKSLREGLAMDKNAGIGEEMREVEAELEEKEHSMRHRKNSMKDHSLSAYELEAGRGRNKGELSPPLSRSPSPPSSRGGAGLENLLSLVLSPAWVQTFIMTFLGEWGDRSQIATIAMAAGQDYWLVTLGAIVGHACCTGVAVVGGRALAGRVSMRVVTIGGAIAFLVFGAIYLYECLAG